ncbi:MAG: transposase [Planctomycetota bacterium]|jgi:REP element-mobilizing transposase RayT
MVFELFDPEGDVRITAGGSLPHWYQPGVTYFITFRTEDSIPSDVARLWHRRRDDWLRRHDVSPAHAGWKGAFERLSREARREFHETFSREYLEHLDRGSGDCALQRPELAQIVANSLRHFDGQRYHVGDFVVMPNHVHLLVCLVGETELEAQCYSWKKFTATEINRHLGRRGRLWQEESFDHLVRSFEQLEAIRRYIAENPARAKLREGEFLHYKRK